MSHEREYKLHTESCIIQQNLWYFHCFWFFFLFLLEKYHANEPLQFSPFHDYQRFKLLMSNIPSNFWRCHEIFKDSSGFAKIWIQVCKIHTSKLISDPSGVPNFFILIFQLCSYFVTLYSNLTVYDYAKKLFVCFWRVFS